MPSSQALHSIELGASKPKPTLIFLPGLSGTTRYWQGRLGALEESHHIVLVDPLGFGDSPKPWTRYTIDRHVAALHQTLQAYAPFTLVGHSMGTLLAIAYATHHPDQVERLVLLSLPYFGGKDKAIEYFRNGPLMNWFLTNMALAVIICVLTRRVFAWLVPYVQPGLPREVAADVVKHSWRSFTSSLWEVIYNYDVDQDADALGHQLPVLCLHGDQDETAPLEGVMALAAGRPNWKVHILPGIDHHPLLRVSEVCQRAIASGSAPAKRPHRELPMGVVAEAR